MEFQFGKSRWQHRKVFAKKYKEGLSYHSPESLIFQKHENACFGKEYISVPLCIYHRTSTKILRKLLYYFILAYFCKLIALSNASATCRL